MRSERSEPSRPLVSVLLPVHNGAAYLHDALESILSQTLSDFELLVIDDCSEDDSATIVAAVRDPRLRLIRSKRRLKLSGALNLGLEKARAAYIARMDADDISLPQRLALQWAYLERHPRCGLCGSWVRTFGAGQQTTYRYPHDFEKIKAFALFDCPFAHPSVMVRKAALDRWGLRYRAEFYPTEDFDLWTRCFEHFSAVNMDRVLLRYRIHGSSLTGASWSAMDEQATRIVARGLEKIGVRATPALLRLHREIALGRLPANERAFSLAERWLILILAANRRAVAFDPAALRVVIGEIWFRACMRSIALGAARIRLYLRSPVAEHGRHAPLRVLWLLLSLVRHGRPVPAASAC